MPGTLKTEDHLYISLETPLGKDALILTEIEGRESLSTPFEFRLEMYAHTPTLDAKKILGREATVSLKFKEKTRYINGIIGEFVQGPTIGKPLVNETKHTLEMQEVTYYTAKLYPIFWVSKFNSDCRIFQNQDALKILKTLFHEHKVLEVKDLTRTRGRKTREYCVQYNESAFDFISRILESEGIFYFFEYSHNKHTLVLGDSDSANPSLIQGEKIDYARGEITHHPFNVAFDCHVVETTVPNAFASSDFNYTTPKTNLTSHTKGKGLGGEVFEYPGKYQVHDVGEDITTLRIQAKENPQRTLTGRSTVPFFISGYKFRLAGHERHDVNTMYVLHTVHHKARYDEETGKFLYENSFEAFPFTTPFRPLLKTPSPKIYGSQTAIVTGKKNEEIWTDNYSRIKVKFHWDRYGKDDETSSCWIRVSTLWAGSQWGVLYTPRIGQEVVVSFLNGDPDRPLVTGSVYNADNMPPYRASDPTKATIKSNTSKGGKGSNEIRLEDKKDHEEIYIHAQKDMNIDIINDRTTKLEKGNCTTTIEAGDRKVTLQGKSVKDENPGGPSKRGNDFLTIEKGNRTVTLNKGDELVTLKDGNRTIKLSKGNETHEITGSYNRKVTEDYTLKVNGNLTIDVTGNITIKSGEQVSMKSGMNFSIKAGQNLTANGSMNTSVIAGMNMTVKGTMTNLKASAMGSYKASGILTLKGALTKIN